MIKIRNNPIDILLNVFERTFPQTAQLIKCIEFAVVDEGFACTLFNEDGIRIYISPTIKDDAPITLEVATELLAHELAHAIAGAEAEHGVVWEAQFDKLNELYEQEAMRLSEAKE